MKRSKNNQSGRIAIFYPYENLETFSPIHDAASLLANHHFKVEIFTIFGNLNPLPSLKNPSIKIISNQPGVFREAGIKIPDWMLGRGGKLYRCIVSVIIRSIWRKIFFGCVLRRQHNTKPYRCIIGVDSEGLVDAVPLSKVLGIPIIYWSLELLFLNEIESKKDHILKVKEIHYSRQSAFVIIQDKWRAKALIEENGLEPNKVLLLPNAPSGNARRLQSNYLRRQFNFPPNRRIILYAGTFADWAMSKELVQAASTWAEEYLLVMHSRQNIQDDLYVEKLIKSSDPHKVVFSLNPCKATEYFSLVDSADIGVAFYKTQNDRYTKKNIKLMGFSSGKLSAYLYRGLPIIVNDITGPRNLIEAYRCGICVQDMNDIASAIKEIINNYDFYSMNAIKCFDEELEFTKHFRHVIDHIDKI